MLLLFLFGFLSFLLVSVVLLGFLGFLGFHDIYRHTKNVGKDNMDTIERAAPTNKGANPFFGEAKWTLEDSRLLLKMGDAERAKKQKNLAKTAIVYDFARSLRLNQHASM